MSPAIWQTQHGQWFYAHPLTGAHYGPFSTEAEAREALAEVRADLAA